MRGVPRTWQEFDEVHITDERNRALLVSLRYVPHNGEQTTVGEVLELATRMMRDGERFSLYGWDDDAVLWVQLDTREFPDRWLDETD